MLFKLCSWFVLIINVDVISVSLEFQVSYDVLVILRVYGGICHSSCREATTITQGTVTEGDLLLSFCPFPSVRFMAEDA